MRLLTLGTILAGTDLTPGSDSAVKSAHNLAAASGAALHVAHVIADDAHVVAQQGARSEFEFELEQNLKRLGTAGASAHTPIGVPAEQLSALADRLNADLIITGRYRTVAHPRELPLGGTAWHVVTHSLVPCLAVLEPMETPLSRAVVGIDYSAASRGAMLVALSWLSALRSRDAKANAVLTVLHVHSDRAVRDPEATREVKHEVDTLQRLAGAWAGVEIEPVTVSGDEPVPVLAAAAAERKVDLVVVGTKGRGDAREGMLGSVSVGLLRQVPAPVLLVPPAVWRNYAKEMDYF